jgi:hypothetical protein
MSSTKGIEAKTRNFTDRIVSALNECALYKNFKPRDSFRPGITDRAKQLIKERDQTRNSVSKAKPEDKPVIQTKYKHLRNRVVYQIRRDTLHQNGEQIACAENESESSKIVNEIIKPRTKNTITINTPEGETNIEDKVAASINNIFVEKINSLKTNIHPNLVKDPLKKTGKKMEGKNIPFSFKTVSVRKVAKVMARMAKKKSKGKDGISQECLLLGLEALAVPLTAIINESIETGVFPTEWKDAIVVPILKKVTKRPQKQQTSELPGSREQGP